MRKFTLLALSVAALSATAPAFAEADMMKDGMHPTTMAKMSAKDMRRMKSCGAMSHKQMMGSAICRRLAKMHPEMMHHGTMMPAAAPMPADDKM